MAKRPDQKMYQAADRHVICRN